mmetsp:Transcript_53004/g.113763  ORF Transcript_53004/g.113763 Transcript_53004/m.113763 type:complete len:378 (-) Transcript_53004:77-1210(-)
MVQLKEGQNATSESEEFAEVQALLEQGQREEAMALFGKAIAAFREKRDRAGEAEALLWLAEANLALGGPTPGRAALSAGNDAAKLFQSLGDRYRHAYALNLAATGALASKSNDEGRKAATGALAIYSELGLKGGQAAMSLLVGKFYSAQGEFQQAIRRGMEAEQLYKQLKADAERANALLDIGQALLDRVNARRSTVTEKCVQEWLLQVTQAAGEARALFNQDVDVEGEAKAAMLSSQAMAQGGQIAEALAMAEEGKRLATDASDFLGIAQALWIICQLSQAINQWEEAAAAAGKAMKLFKEAGDLEGEAKCAGVLEQYKGFEKFVIGNKKREAAAGKTYNLRGHGWDRGINPGHGYQWVRMAGLRGRPAANMRGGK